MDDPKVAERQEKRAIELVVGDKIADRFLPFRFSKGPGEIVFVKDMLMHGKSYVFVAYAYADGFHDCTSFLPGAVIEVEPGTGAQGFSRPADEGAHEPVAGRLPAHLEDGRTGEVELVESHPAEPVVHMAYADQSTVCGLPPDGNAERRQSSLWREVTCPACVDAMPKAE